MTECTEVPLTGGNATGDVVRVGDTVRKPWTPNSARIATFLSALRAQGVDAPRPLPRDDQGRMVLEYIGGTTALESDPLTLSELARVGRMVREIHDASATIPMDGTHDWDVLIPAADADLLCHNDLAPWNLVIGERWVFIDWDGAGPSTRLWDLAYSAQAFTLNDAAQPPLEAAACLRAFVDGYGADADLRDALPQAMAARAAAMHRLLAEAHADGREPWATMHVEGHGRHWRTVTSFVEEHVDIWTRALAV
ncbi:trifolitoxin immunity domain-containing protein [Microbacterium barkeri]|uniref:Trifolitoxin immunity domain-containing protein n=1 Tax=Microbacterium barkeri TaxID=33917 RepID=A0A9W6H091_9MICO|nr:phosphotransferase [Microbacterium barkeri]MDR6875988.1 Ser/Thr protein kinase RdoA (MazF antagonist) [Microbacterium barkeri]GLJ60105.1 trifolitoxin immunity domain-containing protein [Microbacterium barkeri]